MSLTDRWNWLAVLVAVVGMSAIGAGFSGCSQDATQTDAASTDTEEPGLPGLGLGDPKPVQPDPTELEMDVAQPPLEPPIEGAVERVSSHPPAVDIRAGDIPAGDIVAGVDYYIKRVGKSLADESEYEDKRDRISKDAHTLAVLALALGLHDDDNKYKAAAPAMIKAAQGLAATKDHAAAKTAAAALNAAARGEDPLDAELKWEKVASFTEVQEQLSTISSSLKRYARRKKTDECAKFSAIIAVIGQAIICHGDETKEPDELEQWVSYCVEMRDAAAAVNSAMHASDEEAAKGAMADLAQSCETCHAVFHKEEE